MNKRFLRWISVILPVIFLVTILGIVVYTSSGKISLISILTALVVIFLGVIVFSNWIFSFIDLREAEISRRASQLEALNTASQALTTELDLGLVLQKVVDLSRELVRSRYGALGVLDQSGKHFEQFLTSGISEEESKHISGPPYGKGLLSTMLQNEETLLIDDLAAYYSHLDFPKNHPEVNRLLGVPIKTKGKVIGNLYLAEKLSQTDSEEIVPFTGDDQKILEMFAIQAAIAIENARLYRQIQQLAVLEERQRFGMDLHDGVIQSLYAVGLMLENIQRRVDKDTGMSREGISKAITSLNNVISDIRNYILDLRPQHFQGRNIVQGIEELARALRANTFMDVNVEMNTIDPGQLSPEQTVEVLHIAQEALVNVQKHARASVVDVNLHFENGDLEMEIVDDGISITPERIENPSGNGLRNMQERAALLHGEIDIAPRSQGGTEVTLRVPIDDLDSR